LENVRIFITGASGFLGKWIINVLDNIIHTNKIPIKVLVGKYDSFPVHNMRANSFHIIKYDMGRQVEIDNFNPTHIIHLAVDHSSLNLSDETDANLIAANNLILLSSKLPKPPRIIFASSGAVYGKNTKPGHLLKEEDSRELVADSHYGKMKRRSEEIFYDGYLKGLNESVNLRLFAFYGHYLPINRNCASGNFLRDIPHGIPIEVSSKGHSVRTYMHGYSAALRILQALNSSFCGPLNIGGGDPISIAKLALSLGHEFDTQVIIRNGDEVPDYYVPDLARTNKILGSLEEQNFYEEIRIWIKWLKQN
jgi:dTDP-glucose 4,6-dehydratase